jgi:hypothetical protein
LELFKKEEWMRGDRKLARGAIGLMLCMTLGLGGCSTDWVRQGEEIVGTLIPAAANLVTLVAALQGKGVSSNDMMLIQKAGSQAGADLELIQSLMAAYQKADEGAQPGIVSQIKSAMGSVQANLQGLLPALHIEDAATQTKVTAVVGILLSEVQALAAVVPMVEGQGSGAGEGSGTPQVSQNRRDLGHPKLDPGHPKRDLGHPERDLGHPNLVGSSLSASEFVASYNATMTARTGNVELDRVAGGLRIHEHGKAARVASAGILK